MSFEEVVSTPASRLQTAGANRAIRGTADREPPLYRPQDDDSTGIDDPFLDHLVVTDDSAMLQTDDGPVADIPIGLLTDPMDLESIDEGKLGPDLAEVFAFDDRIRSLSDDDEQGPDGQFAWGELDPVTGSEPDDQDDGPIEHRALPLEPLRPLNPDEELDESPLSAPLSTLQIDDIELPWSKERWAELPLPQAFSSRQSLALVGSTLCVGGETTHLLDARHFGAIEDVPVNAKTRRVVCLDSEARRLLVLTTTGQLLFWNRDDEQRQTRPRPIPVPNGEVISMIWQLAPGVPVLSIRLESGCLLEWDDANECVTPAQRRNKNLRLLAVSELGEPRVTVWQGRNHTQLCVDIGTEVRQAVLTPTIERAIADSTPMLAGFIDHVMLGVRNHGLFISDPGSSEFTIVPGCRKLTAFAVGLLYQRPTAFVGLFSELEDRTEIAIVDLTTGRATRVAELSIFTDDAGPADDPPERARIDALLWDASHQRLWAAGCFGLTCFCPPANAIAS